MYHSNLEIKVDTAMKGDVLKKVIQKISIQSWNELCKERMNTQN